MPGIQWQESITGGTHGEVKQKLADALSNLKGGKRISTALEHLVNAMPPHLVGKSLVVETVGDITPGGAECTIMISVRAKSADRRVEAKPAQYQGDERRQANQQA